MYKATKEKNCSTCHYCFETEVSTDLTKLLHCVINPPIITAIGTPQGIANVTAFPQVNGNMICAKFLLSTPKLKVA